MIWSFSKSDCNSAPALRRWSIQTEVSTRINLRYLRRGAGFGRRIASPESRQPPSRFVAEDKTRAASDKSGLLRDAGVVLRLLHQLIIKCDCCTHVHIIASFWCFK